MAMPRKNDNINSNKTGCAEITNIERISILVATVGIVVDEDIIETMGQP
jgi:hypothetical protein